VRASLCCFAVALFAACGDDGGTTEPIAIGFLSPLTGDIAAFGRDLTDASNLALEEINNDGGVLSGREIRLVVYDTGTSATGAGIGYTALLNQGVPVILGPIASSEVVGVREQIKAGTTLTLSQSATSPQLTSLDFGGYFHRLAPSDAVQAVVLAEQVTATAPGSLCIVHRDDPYGNGLTAAVRARVTTPIVEASFDPGLADLSNVLDPCDSLIATPGNAIMFVTLVADGAQLMDDAANRGWSATQHTVFLTDGTKNRDLVTILSHRDFVEGAIGTAPTGPNPDSPEGVVLRDFKSRFRARFSRDADVFAEMAYDALYVAAMAIEIAGSTDSRPAIRDALPKLSAGTSIAASGDWAVIRDEIRAKGQVDFVGASGELSFDPASCDILGPFYISVWTINNGAVVETDVRKIDSL
jgi:branched-chain amino acid transport system substrate-binding protein